MTGSKQSAELNSRRAEREQIVTYGPAKAIVKRVETRDRVGRSGVRRRFAGRVATRSAVRARGRGRRPAAVKRVEGVLRHFATAEPGSAVLDCDDGTQLFRRLRARDANPTSARCGLDRVPHDSPSACRSCFGSPSSQTSRRHVAEFEPHAPFGRERREVLDARLHQLCEREDSRLGLAAGGRTASGRGGIPRCGLLWRTIACSDSPRSGVRLGPEQSLGVARDDRERVVDLVPGPGGEFGQAGELRVAQSLAGLLAQIRGHAVQCVDVFFESSDERRPVSPPALARQPQQVR